jgi:hypothetical protein
LVTGSSFGLSGTDLNGHDLASDGNGNGNCFGGNAGVTSTLPADGSTIAVCPFAGANAFSSAAQLELAGYLGAAAVPRWIKHPHAPKAGFTPLEVFTP